MLAILAMMIFSLFAVNQQEKVYAVQSTMVRQAVTAMLNGAAVERLDEIGSKSFDEATHDDTVCSLSSELSSDSDFGPGHDFTSENDMDDFHLAADTLYRTVGTDALGFVVASEVVYASELNPAVAASSGTRTKYKLVTVTASSLTLPDLEVSISRSFSCGSACQW